MKEYLFPVLMVIAGLVLYHMFVAKALNIGSYEESYSREALK